MSDCPSAPSPADHGLAAAYRKFAATLCDQTQRPGWALMWQTIWLLGPFLLLNSVLRQAKLPEEDYFAPFLLLKLVTDIPSLLLLAAVSLPLILGWKRLRWASFEHARYLQCFVGVLVLALAWAYSQYEYNYYLDRSHGLDRACLLALAALSIWRPGFVPLFLVQAFLLASQFEFPLRDFSWTDKFVLYQTLTAWTAYLFLRLLWPAFPPRAFVLLAFSLVASQYFWSGVAKLQMDSWLQLNDLTNLLMSSYDHGHLNFVGEDGLGKISDTVSMLNGPLMIGTLVLEVGVIVAFWNRWLCSLFLAGLASMHIGIFMSSGICFWKWIILDLALLALCWRVGTRLSTENRSQYVPFVLSVVLILGSSVLWKPVHLAWYDTPVSGMYRVFAVGESGAVQEVAACDLAPYDLVFCQAEFPYLNDRETLSGVYGSTADPDRIKTLRELSTPGEIVALNETLQRRPGDPEAIRRFEHFMRRYFENVNARQGRDSLFGMLSPPHHIWNFPVGGQRFAWQEPIVAIRVRYTETFFDGQQRHRVDDRLVREIEIPR